MLNIKHRPLQKFDSENAELHPIIQKLYSARGITSSSDIKRAAKQLIPISLLAGIDQALIDYEQKIVENLNKEELSQLIGLLDKIN